MKTAILIKVRQHLVIITLLFVLIMNQVIAINPANGEPARKIAAITPPAPLALKAASSPESLPVAIMNISALAPAVPKEANINDYDTSSELDPVLLRKFAPVTPAEADINDSLLQAEVNLRAVKFTVPLEAKFGDF